MWAVSSLFGGGGAKNKEAPKEAIISLRSHLNTLEKKEAYLQKQIDDLTVIAKKNATSNQKAAMNALTRRKMLEKELDKLGGTRTTIETQINAIENVNINYETMKAMKQGAAAMKQIHGSMNADKVDATMDEIQNQIQLSEEISDAISRPVGVAAEIDEDELREELEAMEQEELDNKMLGAEAPPVHVPSNGEVISATKSQAETDEEAELRALQAEMAI